MRWLSALGFWTASFVVTRMQSSQGVYRRVGLQRFKKVEGEPMENQNLKVTHLFKSPSFSILVIRNGGQHPRRTRRGLSPHPG